MSDAGRIAGGTDREKAAEPDFVASVPGTERVSPNRRTPSRRAAAPASDREVTMFYWVLVALVVAFAADIAGFGGAAAGDGTVLLLVLGGLAIVLVCSLARYRRDP